MIDPGGPSPLVDLFARRRGARRLPRRRGQGRGRRPARRRRRADSDGRPGAARRPISSTIVASPTFAVVPPGVDGERRVAASRGFVGSGGYRPRREACDRRATLEANPHYWAGPPAIGTITLITDLGGAQPRRSLRGRQSRLRPDRRLDASWIAYDRTLGPRLGRGARRCRPTTTASIRPRPPFDDVRVRQAFGAAVDWRRIARLARPTRPRRDLDGPARHPRSAATATWSRRTIPTRPGRSSRRPAIRGAGFPSDHAR